MIWPAQRMNAPDPATYSPRQQEIHDQIASGPRGSVRGPLAIWLHRAELAATAQKLGRYCRYDSSLDPKLSELAILVTARIFRSEYEWHAHKAHALDAGLDPSVVEAIRTGAEPDFASDEERTVYELTRAVHLDRQVDDALYQRGIDVLGTERMVDLVGLLGYYTLISLTINVFRIPPMGDAQPELGHE